MHSKYSESIFGQNDRENHQVLFSAQESCIMFCHNKTNGWISEMNGEWGEKNNANILQESREKC